MDFQDVYHQYQPELTRVESILRESILCTNPVLQDSAVRLLEAGGKRIRPLFALVCGRLGESNREPVHALAAALEMIHMATLVHDDVIDDADTRRGRATVRSELGNRAAMYTGEFLFARAIQLFSRTGHHHVHPVMSEAIVRMTQGEIEQIQDFYNWQQNLRDYLRRVERKTALLIAVSCSLGAAVAGATSSLVRLAKQFGYYTGMAFQITDDLLDYEGQANVVGKPVGGDLRQGNLTLPALIAGARDARAPELRSLVQPGMDSERADRAIELIRSSDSLPMARDLAIKYMEKAMNVLQSIPVLQVRNELAVIATYVNQRTS